MLLVSRLMLKPQFLGQVTAAISSMSLDQMVPVSTHNIRDQASVNVQGIQPDPLQTGFSCCWPKLRVSPRQWLVCYRRSAMRSLDKVPLLLQTEKRLVSACLLIIRQPQC